LIAVVGARAVGSPRPSMCPSAEPQLAGVWDDSTRAAAQRAFAATGKPYADDAHRAASAALDAYAGAWVAMRADACKATLERGAQSNELMDLRMTCLDDRLASLRALASRFAQADASVVERAVQAANALPRLADCADAAALRAPTKLPDDPAARARIDAVRKKLADARAVRLTAKPSEGIPVANAIVTEAKEVGYGPLEAEALESQAMQLQLAQDYAGAVKAFQDAQLAAVVAHHRSIETLAWVEMVVAMAMDRRVPDGLKAAQQAHACLTRDGGDEERLALLLVGEGRLAFADAKYDESVDLHKQALAIRERRLPANHPDIATSLNELGVSLVEAGDPDGAIAAQRRALAIREAAFGTKHPLVADSLGNIGIALSEKGDQEEAIAMFKRALDMRIAAYGPDDRMVSASLTNIGLALCEEKKGAEALDYLQRALDIRKKTLGPEHPETAIAYGNLAVPLMRLARWDDAIATATRRIEIQEHSNGPNYPPLSRPLCQIGMSYIGKTDPKAAIPYLERAERLASSPGFAPNVLAQTREQLAIALRDAHGDAKRIESLVKLARDEYVKEGAKGDVVRMEEEFPSK
jgi:tetratricopeptide (TPR) repeat protein